MCIRDRVTHLTDEHHVRVLAQHRAQRVGEAVGVGAQLALVDDAVLVRVQVLDQQCIVNQRELSADTHSFANALRSVLRQDPDVVLIGEMRDLETVEAALRIAETGHLTLATLHTNSAAQTMNRIIDVFPAHQQPQIRVQLSFVLEGIMCQSLLPRASGKGRVVASEVLMPTVAIRNLIREDKIHQVYGMMQTGQSKHGMMTFNQSLANLYFKRAITMQTALSR